MSCRGRATNVKHCLRTSLFLICFFLQVIQSIFSSSWVHGRFWLLPHNYLIFFFILQNRWSPTYDVSSILTSIQSLLDEPNPNSPANSLAAQLYQENKREYEKKVQAIVEQSWQSTWFVVWVAWMWCVDGRLLRQKFFGGNYFWDKNSMKNLWLVKKVWLFAFCRKIFCRNDFRDFLQDLWNTQKFLPFLPLCGKVPFEGRDFRRNECSAKWQNSRKI